jgi:hypothetical protein
MPPTSRLCLAACSALLACILPAASYGAGQLTLEVAVERSKLPTGASRKGDRLRTLLGGVRKEIHSTQVEGVGSATRVTMRVRDGSVGFYTDPVAGVTSATKNVSIPPFADAPTMPLGRPKFIASESYQPPKVEQESKDSAAGLPTGCERVVSVLVRSTERDRVGRCIS